jgi:hypothetical protein
MSDWIEFMAFSKYRVNKKTGAYESLGGWVKEMGAPTKKKSSKPKKVEIKTFTVEEELL